MIKIKLSRILGEKRMTQKDLSRLTGIRPATINELYHEIAIRVNLEHINKICEVLECDLHDLFEYFPDKVKTTGKNLIIEEHGNQRKNRNKE